MPDTDLAGEAMSTAAAAPRVPLLRGRLHQAAFFLTIPAGVTLVFLAHRAASRTAAVIYALSLAGMYGTSAAYHRLRWSPRARQWVKRFDHSMIFVFIAGTYTPFSLLVLHKPWSVVMLSVVWAGALAGIVLKMLDADGLKAVTGTLYIGLGWLAIVAGPQMVRGLSGTSIALLVTGGILYTTGAVVLARNRPNPSLRLFGYHEVWHSFVVGGSACHYVVVLLVILSAR
jgi:hemolysin III